MSRAREFARRFLVEYQNKLEAFSRFSNIPLQKVENAAPFLLALSSLALAVIIYYFFYSSKYSSKNKKNNNNNNGRALSSSVERDVEYDVIIVGGSITGTATSIQFAKQGRKVLVLEKDLGRPDTIIGELLQPAGLNMLREMGLEQCALKVGVKAHGYASCLDGEWVDLPFPNKAQGVSFHHGDFVMELRKAMVGANNLEEVKKSGGSLTVIEGVADCFVFDSKDSRLVRGVRYREKIRQQEKQNKKKTTTTTTTTSSSSSTAASQNSKKKKKVAGSASPRKSASTTAATKKSNKKNESSSSSSDSDDDDDEKDQPQQYVTKTVLGHLTVDCSGVGSVFRELPTKNIYSHFVGLVLRHVKLEVEQRGNVILGKHGIILSYRIDPNEVRFLVDYRKPGPLPARTEVMRWLREDMKPDLPEHLQQPFEEELKRAENGEPERVRARPHYHYTQVFPEYRGCIHLSDVMSQQMPLTGSGMTSAFRDAYHFSEALKSMDSFSGESSKNRDELQKRMREFLLVRPSRVGVMKVLSWALHGVMSGPEDIKRAVMYYFKLGGDCIDVPLLMLAGLESRFSILFYHYCWTMLAGAEFMITGGKGNRSVFNTITFFINPVRIFKALMLLAYAVHLFGNVYYIEFCSKWKIFDRTKW